MIKKKLGKTGLEVSIIGLGGLGIIDKFHPTYASSSAVINYALDNGVNFIETGRSYFDSEDRIGAAVERRRKDCIIASKTMSRDAASAKRDIETSLKRLRTNYMDIYQLHDVRTGENYDRVMATGGAFKGLVEAKKEGKVRFIGFSSHKPETALKLIETGRFDTIQLPYNPIDAKIFKPVLDAAVKKGLGIIVMKPLAGGILSNATSALRFIFEEDISTVILGANSIEQLKIDIEAGNTAKLLTDTEKEILHREIAKLGDSFCRQCRYCVTACPEGIPIPDIFRLERFVVTYYMRDVANSEYALFDKNALSCLECGRCIERCPYGLEIPKMLKRSHKNITKRKPQEIIFGALDFLRMTRFIRSIAIFFKHAGRK